MAKVRYQLHKEELAKEYDDTEDIDSARNFKKRKKLTETELEEIDKIDELEAESRRIYDPLLKSFDHGNKRCTDMVENKKVY